MQRALVLGRAVATSKHPTMNGQRILLMQPLAIGGGPDGEPMLVVDSLGAAMGGVAVISSDGKHARQALGNDNTPVRYTTIALEDPA